MLKVKSYKLKVVMGFTILEAIIAIAVVSLAIAGTTGAVRTGLVGSSIAKEDVKAFYLAQEAIEVIRNKRDSNAIAAYHGSAVTWVTGISDPGSPCAPGNTCTVDATVYPYLSNTGCGPAWNSCPYLNQDSTSYLMGYTSTAGWVATNYRREVQIENVSPTEIDVTVQITWMHGANTRSFKTKTILTNWF